MPQDVTNYFLIEWDACGLVAIAERVGVGDPAVVEDRDRQARDVGLLHRLADGRLQLAYGDGAPSRTFFIG